MLTFSNRCKINIKYEDREVHILAEEDRDGAGIVQRGVCDQMIHVGCMKNRKIIRNKLLEPLTFAVFRSAYECDRLQMHL